MSETLSSSVVAVLTTAPDLEVAQRLGGVVVEERLAACANVVPGVTSIFWWNGALEREREVLVIFKTTNERVEALRQRVVELHPYDVPEVLAVTVDKGHEAYLDWVRAEVRSS